jgi:ABC-2 type transport system permease protein
MRIIACIIRKEFIQFFRNKVMVRIIFVMPILQLFVLAYAATFEIKTIRLHVIDLDHSHTSRDLISHFSGSRFYQIVNFTNSYAMAEEDIMKNRADQVLQIPADFEKDLRTTGLVKVQIVTNAINGSAASLMNAYTLSIIQDYNKNILTDISGQPAGEMFNITYSYWYNPDLDYINYMVPGILVLLVTLIGMFLSGMNLVKEKEIGTIEQINVTPIKKYQFIIGKLIPYWLVALGELAFGLTIAKLAFQIPIVGSIWLIFLVAAVYLLVALGLGLLISTKTATQQQAMFLSWFFMVIFIIMSGLFTPVDTMPRWAQIIDWFNPIKYFVEVIRMIMLKGSGLQDILQNFLILVLYGTVALSVAVWQYRKVS